MTVTRKSYEMVSDQTAIHSGGCCCCRSKLRCCIVTMVSVIACLALAFGIFVGAMGYPLHASCEVDWTFGEKCDSVSLRIVKQIQKWNDSTNCGEGQKCLYSLTSYDRSGTLEIKAKHETPVKHYVDDLTFTFKMADTLCATHGFSTSETWYAYLDYGTNYCNLHNLITGAGLDKTANYTEKTSDSRCTQYTSSNCTKY